LLIVTMRYFQRLAKDDMAINGKKITQA